MRKIIITVLKYNTIKLYIKTDKRVKLIYVKLRSRFDDATQKTGSTFYFLRLASN